MRLKQLALLAGFAFVATQAGSAVGPAQAGTPDDTVTLPLSAAEPTPSAPSRDRTQEALDSTPRAS